MATATSSSIESVNPFEEVVPLSVSASASSSSAPPFDVFINHCGADVKFTLATTIHDKLNALGLSVFLDVHSLRLGDVIPAQIEEAMRTASLHIAIFSQKYAHSPWCLAELSFMLKTGKRIIPVFYHVDPSDLRWVGQGKGIYAPAFSQHKEKDRYSEKKLDEWKKALESVSFGSGCVIKDNRDEAMQLKNIVNMASKVLETVALVVADKPVGLDDIVRDFERNTVESTGNEHNAQIVGIVGMGGAGKTTLAKELYNRKSSSFQSSSIVFAVRDAASRDTLHEKQKKILGDLGVQGLSFDNIEEGKALLANRLRSVCALIILDDVDHRSQLDALLPPKDRLASGSLVIVTTRELHLLAKWGSTIYRMKPLNPFHAKELFCSHAFLQSSPIEGFESIVEEFLEACHGLPLSLEVMGGLVFGRSKDFWKSQLDKISRMLPEDIRGRLKVSYDALDEEDKDMFMDVACFFIGEKISLAIEVWDGSGWSGLHGWETLVNKCLVNVDESDCITMHDHLRDLGRDLADRHTPSRVWLKKHIMNIQKQAREGWSIRGIDAGGFEYTGEPLGYWQRLKKFFELIGILNRYFGRLRYFWRTPPPSLGLKLFAGKEEIFMKYFCTSSEEPAWLRFDRYNGRKLHQLWSLKKLRILELRSAYWLRELWDNSDLRELIIDNANMLQRIPNSIGRLEELKMIALTGCVAMKNLPEEFCGLRSLEWLQLSSCSILSSLPPSLGDLINLRHVDLSYCERLQNLPDSFKQLRHLQHLNLSYCTELTLTSDMLENISNLVYCNFEGCRKLEELPNQITRQVFLRELNVNHTGIREVPSDIGELKNLEALEIESPFLASLPSSLGNLYSLSRLSINSPLLINLPSSFHDLSRLTELHLIGCKMLNSLPDFAGSLSMLKSISINSTAVSIISISEVSCPSLEILSLRNNGHLVDIQTLPTSVRRLDVSDCTTLKKIMGLRGLADLQYLFIVRCPELNELASFADLHSLKEVKIEDCDKVVKIEGLQNSRSLETLEAVTRWKSQAIQSLEGTEKLKKLKMVVENISALQPCIQTIKKWPGEMLICGRAVSGAESVMDSLSFPTLKMVNSSLEKSASGDAWEAECGKRHSSDAAIVCLLVNSFANSTFRFFFSDGNASMRLREGKWVIVGVWRQNCSLMDKLTMTAQRWNGEGEVERAILLVGEEGRVIEAFTHFWALFI
ncbi:disease resistance protein RPV1 isoform X2 [Cryptomeria japonica]|uniref:disease resistance protein RPV1 isoform X2 n=1 Tax=Cryptomeria japonica TaxID=3369 RepID=UPI0027DA8ACE|nr:disease resistance protein RPV1 isoform X2 [Cryptomeria japonica]